MAMVDQAGNQTVERALLDYFDGLLHDSDEPVAEQSLHEPARDVVTISATTMTPAANVTPLANARSARPARVVEPLQTFAEPRPFAEAVRPLRMPLPPLADISPAPVETKVSPAPVIPVAVSPAPVISAPVISETVAPAKTPPMVPAPAIPSPAVAEPPMVVAEAATVVDDAATPTPPTWADNGRPHWAQEPFECLLFKSGGLTLAVPLVELGSIYPLEEGDISGIFGQIDWFLGLMHTKYGHVRVVDSARVVMPERYQEEMAAAYRFVLTLDASDWGLAIDAIAGTALLDPDAVRWRNERSKRPWLAGTVVEKMCALLDVAQMRHMFNQLDRKRGDQLPR